MSDLDGWIGTYWQLVGDIDIEITDIDLNVNVRSGWVDWHLVAVSWHLVYNTRNPPILDVDFHISLCGFSHTPM